MKIEHINIDGIKYNLLGTNGIVGYIDSMLKSGITKSIYYINTHVLNLLRKNEEMKKVFNDNFVICDGTGIYIMLKLISGKINISRCVSTDVWNGLLEICSNRKLNIAFYGGMVDREKELKNFIKTYYPGINIVMYSDGYKEFKNDEQMESDILFIGTGSFNQELLAHSLRKNENIKLKICVGSAIDYWTGAKKRAPAWMQKIGMEWLYRLFQEPGRLWKRYVAGIPVFLFYVLVQKVKLILKK